MDRVLLLLGLIVLLVSLLLFLLGRLLLLLGLLLSLLGLLLLPGLVDQLLDLIMIGFKLIMADLGLQVRALEDAVDAMVVNFAQDDADLT